MNTWTVCVCTCGMHAHMLSLYCNRDSLTSYRPFSLLWCDPEELVNLAKQEFQLVLLHVG